MHGRAMLVAVMGAILGACGSSYSSSSPAPPQQSTGFFITISNMSFSPLDLRVPPGGTVTVINQDSVPHSVTSETTLNAFTPGAVSGISFDTGEFGNGTKTFSIPPTAATSTVVPYYCTFHKGTMATPNGAITIDPTATPGPAPGGGGGGGY
jgi:plastocyanin